MSKRKRIYVSVISDLVTDQRVHRTCSALASIGFEVLLIGRKLKSSLQIENRNYRITRFKLWWEKGWLFYANYNIRLFFFLLFSKADFLFSNDLDTLTANFLVAKIRNLSLYYDSHEYFTGVPELVNRPKIQKIWKWLERKMIRKVNHVFTVNESIAEMYRKEYSIHVDVIRNIPFTPDNNLPVKSKSEFNIPSDKKVFLFQGAGINIDRGAEELIHAIKYVDAVLLFIGSGDVINIIKKLSSDLKLNDKIFFIPRQPMNVLSQYTRMADFGVTLDKPTNINYLNSLPNKLFDYIHAGLPILASDLPEVSRIIRKYDIGMISSSHDPEKIAEIMNEMLRDENKVASWKKNLKLAANELSWENEQEKLLSAFKDVT